MQIAFSFGRCEQITAIRNTLREAFPITSALPKLLPMAQLIKSIISSKTKDTISWPTFFRLVEAYPTWQVLAEASIADVEQELTEVTHAKDKAGYLLLTLREVGKERPDFDLSFLGGMPVEEALAWLRKLSGSGPKVAASVLNFSTLNRPSFVVDTHVLRVLQRLGIVPARADYGRAYKTVMGLLPDWSAGDLAELHVLMKRLGQTSCTQLERCCDTCPIRKRCGSGLQHTDVRRLN